MRATEEDIQSVMSRKGFSRDRVETLFRTLETAEEVYRGLGPVNFSNPDGEKKRARVFSVIHKTRRELFDLH